MHTKKELDARLLEAGVSPLKRLGQNFLVNPQISARMVDLVRSLNPASVFEVGPGLGALTDELLTGPWKTQLIELDAGLVRYWKQRAQPEAVSATILHGDALQLNWNNFETLEPSVLVSNLPYSIAASLVMELSSLFKQKFSHLILMFQKEVAERIEAEQGSENYGLLSVVAQGQWKIKRVVDAGPQDFFPVPNVGSRVLHFEHRAEIQTPNFLAFVKQAFSQRRKKMISNLAHAFSEELLLKIFGELDISLAARAQELTPEQFKKFFQKLIA